MPIPDVRDEPISGIRAAPRKMVEMKLDFWATTLVAQELFSTAVFINGCPFGFPLNQPEKEYRVPSLMSLEIPTKSLGLDSPSFSTILLFKTRIRFPRASRVFFWGKTDPWKDGPSQAPGGRCLLCILLDRSLRGHRARPDFFGFVACF